MNPHELIQAFAGFAAAMLFVWIFIKYVLNGNGKG
jgi:hypothetical protein